MKGKARLSPRQVTKLAYALENLFRRIQDKDCEKFKDRSGLAAWAGDVFDNTITITKDTVSTVLKHTDAAGITGEERPLTWDDLVVKYNPADHLKPFKSGKDHPQYKHGKSVKSKKTDRTTSDKLAFLEAAVRGISFGQDQAVKRITDLETKIANLLLTLREQSASLSALETTVMTRLDELNQKTKVDSLGEKSDEHSPYGEGWKDIKSDPPPFDTRVRVLFQDGEEAVGMRTPFVCQGVTLNRWLVESVDGSMVLMVAPDDAVAWRPRFSNTKA